MASKAFYGNKQLRHTNMKIQTYCIFLYKNPSYITYSCITWWHCNLWKCHGKILTEINCPYSKTKLYCWQYKRVPVPTILDKIFGTKWSNPVKLDMKRQVWYLYLCVFNCYSQSLKSNFWLKPNTQNSADTKPLHLGL